MFQSNIRRFLLCLLTLSAVFTLAACRQQPDGNQTQDSTPPTVSIFINQAVSIAKSAGETATEETYTVIGTVKTVLNPNFGEMIVEDGTGELYIYGSMAPDGTYYDQMADRPVKGDKVVLTGVLTTFDGQPQMGTKDKKAIISSFTHASTELDSSEYPDTTLAQARDAEKGAKVKVSGTVAAVTYANGQIPCGFILVNEGISIYVYDRDAAMMVSPGNAVTLAASKTYWILESEQANAERYGYQGACQLEDVILLSNEPGDGSFPKDGIAETTVKKLLNTPFSENITTQLYKVTGLVEKKEGTGFTNYYIRDLDGTTGSYTYTQCNGSDFAWLDAYDGKICTVYLTALNAKSAPAECFYRLLPVAVEVLDNFVPTVDFLLDFAIEYGVIDLIGTEYSSDPALNLPSSYCASLLGGQTVTLTYTSSNEAVARITDSVLHLVGKGTADITVTAAFDGKTFSRQVSVAYDPVTQEITTPTVAEIIALPDDTLVQIRGVVISSLVNRDGFYIGDETGMIAVLTDAETLSKVKPGDQVVMEGYKVHHKKAGSDHCIGQCAIVGSVTRTADHVSFSSDAKLIANYFGNHDYATGYFAAGMTIDQLYELDAMEDYTTTAYRLTARVVLEGNQYFSQILLQDENGTNKLRLYCSSANQYGWLQAFEGQTVELELALCNWNDKDYYTGCVISVTVNGTKTLNTLNFQ